MIEAEGRLPIDVPNLSRLLRPPQAKKICSSAGILTLSFSVPRYLIEIV